MEAEISRPLSKGLFAVAVKRLEADGAPKVCRSVKSKCGNALSSRNLEPMEVHNGDRHQKKGVNTTPQLL
ncbi:unnamed protein product [Sphagnum jensenii]